MIILGLNSGTSRDGISGVIFDLRTVFPHPVFNLLWHQEFPYPKSVLNFFSQLEKKPALEILSRADFFLGEVFAETSQKIIKKSGLSPNKIDLIASHGQTIAHFPKPPSPKKSASIIYLLRSSWGN